ncbi:MAG TPA: hypothetical protein DEA08_12495 [Planctomycetes bacterium]|nr:hypothetical protein [Planctomycetota bacterium]
MPAKTTARKTKDRKERKDRNKDEGRSARILEAADALFCERGFAGTSLRDVAKDAEVNKGLIVYYYQNKAGLFSAVLERYYEAHGAALAGLSQEGPLRERILRGFERANEVIREVGVGATTLVVVEAAPGWVRTYCCGDSQALLVGGRGKLKLVTLPHSPVGYAVEAGFLEEAEARGHEERHLVSNLLGDDALRVTMHGPVERAAQDTVVVASDGLFDNLDPEAVAELACARPLEEAARALAERAWERMASGEAGTKVDDLALVLHRVG